MKPLSENERRVGSYYDDPIFQAELDRLPVQFPVEFAMTGRYLLDHIRAGSVVAEIGVGGGHYTRLLAGRGCKLHLVDVSRKLLEAVQAKLCEAGLGAQVLGSHHRSATSLDTLPAACCDAVLLMGPLYHLCRLADRRKAVRETARILKNRGLVFAAGINRLAYLRDLFRDSPELIVSRKKFHDRHLRDGNLDPEHAPPIGYAHMTGVQEFRKLLGSYFTEVTLVAVESFIPSPAQSKLNELPAEAREAWLGLIARTARWPEAFGLSDHYLFIGRKAGRVRAR